MTNGTRPVFLKETDFYTWFTPPALTEMKISLTKIYLNNFEPKWFRGKAAESHARGQCFKP